MAKKQSLDDLFNNSNTMEKFKLKGKLMVDHAILFEGLADYYECFVRCNAKDILKLGIRSVKRDFRKALRIINQRVPVLFELPKIETPENGIVKKVDPKTKEPINNELEVHEGLPNSNSGYIEYSEE